MFNKIEWLNSRNTRYLLKLLKECRKFNGYMDMTESSSSNPECWITINDLKRVLATREHIPNKQEAKLLRQKKMKEKRNR